MTGTTAAGNVRGRAPINQSRFVVTPADDNAPLRPSVTSVPRLIALDLPLGPRFRAEVERCWMAEHAVLPLDQRMAPSVRRALAASLGADELVSVEGRSPIDDSRADSLVPLEPGDALVIATSGTTGAPRGVVHTFDSLGAHARLVGARLGLSDRDHWWLCIPVAHIGGFGVLSRALEHGSLLTFSDTVSSDTIAAARRAGATHTSIVPTLLARHDFSDWQLVLVGGGRSGTLPTNAVSTYGLTETCGGIVYDGRPLDGCTVKMLNGEIHVRTPSLARTFRHAPLPVIDGWLATGDLGTMVEDRLRIDGRRDDLIVTGGNKVWPHVVEQRLREHPLVKDVAVSGLPDAEWGAVVSAWVVARDHSRPPTLELLRNHVKETLASYYAPRRLVVVDAIPRSSLGKVLLHELHSRA